MSANREKTDIQGEGKAPRKRRSKTSSTAEPAPPTGRSKSAKVATSQAGSSKAGRRSETANKKRRTSTSTRSTVSRPSATPSRRLTATAARKAATSPRSRKAAKEATLPQQKVWTMPLWMRNLLAVVVVLVFSVAFYFIGIRPYAYRWKPCYGLKGYNVCLPYGYQVHGIDISHYQGAVNWTALTAEDGRPFPLSFIFMKATEGGDMVDDRFEENFRQAREHGLVRGAYHYFLPQSDPLRQAEHFIRTVHLEPGDLPPVLDVETTGRCSSEELQQAVSTWMDRVEQHYGVRPLLYTSYRFKTRHLSSPQMDTYPYWIAHYYVDSVRYQGRWQFWQHTDVGQVPGISERVDLDVFNGTLEQLLEMTIPMKNEP